VDYTLIRSQRRTLAVEITRDGRVVVRAPKRLPQQTIDAFVASRAAWIETHLKRRQQKIDAHPPLTQQQIDALRQKAKAVLPQKVAYWAQKMGVAPTGVKITSARTRFGSCSGKNSLCFSLYLMEYPEDAIDAVVVHELAHIRHRDHSPAFYAEVERWMSDYRQRAKLLKQ
jgi:predicted metal-dependent hydrolase